MLTSLNLSRQKFSCLRFIASLDLTPNHALNHNHPTLSPWPLKEDPGWCEGRSPGLTGKGSNLQPYLIVIGRVAPILSFSLLWLSGKGLDQRMPRLPPAPPQCNCCVGGPHGFQALAQGEHRIANQTLDSEGKAAHLLKVMDRYK